jgi:hypothetical protein
MPTSSICSAFHLLTPFLPIPRSVPSGGSFERKLLRKEPSLEGTSFGRQLLRKEDPLEESSFGRDISFVRDFLAPFAFFDGIAPKRPIIF